MVVVHDGKVIAERYAAGVGVDTPLPGFSMTKSVVNALIGILTQQGLVTPSMPAPIPEWRGADDPRREIEVEHLMRMTTGLDLDETNSGFDRSSRMFLQDDMAAYAVNAKMIAPLGQRWHYSSATTQILARIVRDAVGGPEQTLAFAWRELFNPLGMRSVTLEFDNVGTLQGATNMLASARDWAKFGLLYLNDGVVGEKRILHEDWVDFCAAATLDTDYAAGFWTNRSEHPNARGRVQLGMPRDAFFASGDLGQRVVIMPSQKLVVVRLGDSVDPTGDIRGLARLVKEVIAAVQRPSFRGDAKHRTRNLEIPGLRPSRPSRNDGAQGSATAHGVRPALFQRARIGRPRVDAFEIRHRPGVALLQPAARRGGLQRKTHLDVGAGEFAAGEPFAFCKFAFPVVHVLLELRIDQAWSAPCCRPCAPAGAARPARASASA